MNLTPNQLETLATNCAKPDTNVHKELWEAAKKSMANPPQTILHNIRAAVGKTITKTGTIIDPQKKSA